MDELEVQAGCNDIGLFVQVTLISGLLAGCVLLLYCFVHGVIIYGP